MKKVLQSVQWMAFIVLANVVYPLAVGQGFNLTSHDTMMFIQRTIFMLGVAAIIQLFFGHKLYISEVPSGLWFGIFLIKNRKESIIYVTFATHWFQSPGRGVE